VVVEEPERRPTMYIVGHSNFFYWWPAWVLGVVMAGITYASHNQVVIDPNGGVGYFIARSKDVGVIYTLVLFLIILVSNVNMRGVYSLVVVLAAVVFILLAAYMGWWPHILGWFGQLDIYMNMGFYVAFSTLLAVVWFINFFLIDRMTYFKLTPGQLTHETVLGGAAKSYDTRGMAFEKERQDLFRQWIIGLGTADLKIATMGAHRETLTIPNVLFADAKVRRIQQLIAMHPNEFTAAPPV
jgi:hypothetical protein